MLFSSAYEFYKFAYSDAPIERIEVIGLFFYALNFFVYLIITMALILIWIKGDKQPAIKPLKLCGRTYRRWVLFTGRFRWQQAGFNAMAQYGCNAGMTQVQRRDNAFNRLSLLVPRPTCPTILDRSRTATGA